MAQINVFGAALFIMGVYVALIGSKVTVALVVERSKTILKSKYYTYAIRALGIVLIIFALIFIRDGLQLIGLL
jgi:hypothetical protein